MNEAIEINDLALTEDQQAAVKGGPIVMEDCLVSSFQSGGHEGAATGTANNRGVLLVGVDSVKL